MPAALWMGGLGRVQIVGMAAAGWFLQGQSLVYAMLALLFLFGVFMGAQRVVFGMLMAKVIPLSRRGRLQAWRNATGGLIAAILAWAAGKYIIEPDLFGHGYSVTFMLAAVLTSLGLWALQLLLREPEPPNLPAKARLRDRLRDFPALIRSDPGYAPFLLVQMLATASRMAVPFYAIYATSSTGLSVAILGLLALAYLGADTLSNLLWGYLGDRTGFRLVLLVSISMWIGATLILLGFHSPAAIFIAFFGLGAAQSGYMMAAQTMILEFGNREEMPMRIAISSSAEGITASISPIVGGLVADAFGYPAVFGISIAFLALSLLFLVLKVQEPRNRRLAGV
jgi:MFS family permease